MHRAAENILSRLKAWQRPKNKIKNPSLTAVVFKFAADGINNSLLLWREGVCFNNIVYTESDGIFS